MSFGRAWFVGILTVLLCSLLSAQTKIDSLKGAYSSARHDSTRCQLLVLIAKEYQKSSNDSSALSTLKQALQLARINNISSGEADALGGMGNIYFYKFEYDSAINYYAQSLEIQKKALHRPKIAQLLFYMGTAYLRQTKYDKALNKYLQALKVYETLDDNYASYGLLNNIGGIYYNQNNYEKTLEYFLKALAAIRKTDNKVEIASELNNIGQLYAMMNKNQLAVEYFQQALTVNRQTDDKLTFALILGNIGSLYLKMQDYETALRYLMEARQLNTDLNNKLDLSNNLTNLAEAYEHKGDLKNSVRFLTEALHLESETQDKEQLKLTYKQLASVYNKQKKYDLAYLFQQRYSNLVDSLFSTESSKQIAEMETKYQTEQKEKDNQLLNQQLALKKIEGRQQQLYLIFSGIGLIAIGVVTLILLRQNKQKRKANQQLSEKNKIIGEQHKDITDSIRYAQRIQQAILPPEKMWFDLLPDSFVLYKPKDILSGDFYWIEGKDEHVYIAAADCTGHGVPGALMSVVNFNLLNKAVLEQQITTPRTILDAVNQWLTVALHQTYNESAVRDGMDIALCALNKKTGRLQFAGAYNGGYVFRKDGSFLELNGDKFPVGAFIEENVQSFSGAEIQLEEGDRLFIFSDGYADQFGGPKGKKLKYTQFKKFIQESLHLAMEDQKKFLNQKFEEWKGQHEQVDDVLVIGISFN